MAIPVQEEKIPFKKEANVPYRYTCGSCGRTVEGEAIISATYLLHKKPVDDWDKPDKKALEITDEDVDYAERASASMLEREIGIWKRQTAGGNYSILGSGCSCPHCGAVQKWNYSAKRTGIWLAVCLLFLGLGVAFLATAAGSTWEGGTDTARLLWGIVFVVAGAAAALPVVFSIKGKRSKGQKTAPPAIFWEELRRTED